METATFVVESWADILRCTRCGTRYRASSTGLACDSCGASFPIVDGVPVLLKQSTIGTTLEQIDYDATHGLNEQTIDLLGRQWSKVLSGGGRKPKRALEIGAGTGALTLGLLKHKVVGSLTVSDVSAKFIRLLRERAAAYSTPLSFVICDANEPHFREGAFDAIVGRSILHHLLDYDQTLRQCYAILPAGGQAVFFEPVIEGKTPITTLLALVARSELESGQAIFTPEERAKIEKQIRHQTKSKWYPQDRKSLAKIEDKFIFEIEALKSLGRGIGFRQVEFRNNGNVDPTYWPYLKQTFRVMGIAPEKLGQFEWIGQAFAETHGLMFAERLATPMGFFIFEK